VDNLLYVILQKGWVSPHTRLTRHGISWVSGYAGRFLKKINRKPYFQIPSVSKKSPSKSGFRWVGR